MYAKKHLFASKAHVHPPTSAAGRGCPKNCIYSHMTDFVVPGQPITSEVGYLRGHGAYIRSKAGNETEESAPGSGVLIASVAGRIERVNKLISVKALKSRYLCPSR